MNLNLTDTLENYIKEQVDAGLYNSASEFIREAVRLKMRADETHEAKLQALRSDIDIACKQIENGEFVEFEPKDMLDRVKKKSA